MIVGIIMALSIRSIKIIKSSYASLTYFEFNTIKQIAAELIAGQTPTPLLDEDEKPIQLNSTIDGKNGKKLKQTVEQIPLERIVLETDCPYLAPEPNRGKRNDSSYLPLVADEIAKIRGISADEVIRATWENARRLYRIP